MGKQQTDVNDDVVVDEDTGSQQNDTASSSDNDNKQEKTFTQTQVSNMMSKEKHQGKNAAFRSLGIDPDNNKLIQSVKNFVSAQSEEADDDKASDNDVMQELANTKALVEVMKAGVKPQYADDAVALIMAKSDKDDASFAESLSEYKQRYKEWFDSDDSDDAASSASSSKEDTDDDNKMNGTGSTPSASGKKQTEDKQAGIGKRLAASRKKSLKKSSYWN